MKTIGPFSALSWHFTVTSDNDAALAMLGIVLAPLTTGAPQQPDHQYVLTSPTSTSPGRLTVGREVVVISNDDRDLYGHVLWHVNLSAVRASTEYVLVHAAAAEVDGRAVVLPAPAESGKTTLVAGLVRSGMRYLTDEAVAIDPPTRRIVPFPKSLAVDRGSWAVLPELKPRTTARTAHLQERQWQVPPTVFRSDAVSDGAVPAVVVLPRYRRGADTELRPITPGSALVEVLQQTFELPRQPRRDMEVLARVLESCPCFTLEIGDLEEGVALVRQALHTS